MKIKFLKPFRFIGNNPDDGSDDTVPVGHIVDLENDESTQWLIDNGFAEEAKESGWWKPKTSEEYYYLAASGEVYVDSWVNGGLDELRYSMGACFKTKKAAEYCRDYLKAIATVRQDEGVLTPEQINELEWRQGKAYHVGYTCKQNGEEVRLIDLYETWAPVGVILFDTEEHAQASLDKHPDEWEIIANYDWSRE